MQNHRLIDKAPNHPTQTLDALHSPDPDLPAVLWRIITGYTPNPPSSAWVHVRSFVIECVIAMKPRTHANTRRLMTMTALYVSWVWTVTGCDLLAERVFKDSLVHRYLAEKLPNHSATYRFDTTRQLSAIGAALTSEHIERLRTPFQCGRVRPYTTNEEAALYSWANTLSTPLKQQNAKALLGLAGGAGLTALELMTVQVEEVELAGGRVFVNLHGDRPRRIPVRAAWARTLTDSIAGRTSGNLFSGYRLEEYPPHELQRFLSDNPCTPRPSAARLHSGWIVTQLDAGIPFPILLEIAGFTSVQSLEPYLQYTRKQHRIDDYIGRITGEEVA